MPRPVKVPMPTMVPMLALAPMPATVLRSATVRPCYCNASEGTEVRSSVGRSRGEEEAMASFIFSNFSKYIPNTCSFFFEPQ